MTHFRFLTAALLVLIMAPGLQADKVELNPIADVVITTYGGGEGGNVFMKFSLAALPAATVDSAFLEVYVWEADTGWDGDLSVMNVHNQTWDESTPDTVLWYYTTSGSSVALGFGDTLLGWTKSTDIGQVLQPDLAKKNRFTSIKLKDPDDMTMAPGMQRYPYDGDDSLVVGNIFDDRIIFYPHEHDSMPKLTIYYTPRLPAGGSSKGLLLDGTDDMVRISNDTTLDFGDSAFTVSAWISTDRGADQQIVAKRDDSNWSTEPYWELKILSTGEIQGEIKTSSTAYAVSRTTGTYNDNFWYEVTMVYSANDVDLYINGTLDDNDSTGAGKVGDYDNDNPVYIGGYINQLGSPADVFGGSLDEVRIWDKALSTDEMTKYRYAILTGSEPGLVGQWRFDLLSGSSAPDYTGNDNHADLLNTAGTVWQLVGAWVPRIMQEDAVLAGAAGYHPDGIPVVLTEGVAPKNGAVVYDNDAISFAYTPDSNWFGIDTFAYFITDTASRVDTFGCIVEVQPVNDPPVITSAAVDTAEEESLYMYLGTATDPDDTPTITIEDHPGWATASDETLSGPTPLGSHGDTTFMVIASDGEYADTLIVKLAIKDSLGFVPVVLSSFTAQAAGGNAVLAWTTESEQDNLGFNVLRSDAVSGSFIQVNSMLITGAGTTSLPHNYAYTDTDVTAGTWYYKLEMVDVNGIKTYSAELQLTIGQLTVDSKHINTGSRIVNINSINGEGMYTVNGIRINKNDLQPGVYFVRQEGRLVKVLVIE